MRSSPVALVHFEGSTTTRQKILTGVTGGASVSGSIACAAEAVPRLFTPAAVLAVIGHTPLKDKQILLDLNETEFRCLF